MVSKHVCGYEQKLTRIYDYGYTYDKRGNLVKEEEICSPTTTGHHHGFEEITNYYSQVTCSYAVIKGIRVGALKSVLYDGVYSILSTMKTKIDNLPR